MEMVTTDRVTAGLSRPVVASDRRARVVPTAARDGRVEHARAAHLKMVEAILAGEGLPRVAELTANELAAPVVIIVPRLRVACRAPRGRDEVIRSSLGQLERYVSERIGGRRSLAPVGLVAETPIVCGNEVIGYVLLLRGSEPPPEFAGDYLHMAAAAAVSELAVQDAREAVVREMRGSLLEELRSCPDGDGQETVRRATRLGCDLANGAVALCVEPNDARPGQMMATIVSEYPGALAQRIEASTPGGTDRVYALLPAGNGGGAMATGVAGRKLASRLSRSGAVGLSSFHSDPADLGTAIREAELVLNVLRQSDGVPWFDFQDVRSGIYRLLFRMLASHAEEARSFYEETVGPIVRYDGEHHSDLVGTLDAYLEQNCNMNATAATIYAHRHTIAYRLDKVRALTGLDPTRAADREQLALGLKIHRIIARTARP